MAIIIDKPIWKWEPPDMKHYPPYATQRAQCTQALTSGERCPRMSAEGYEKCEVHHYWEVLLPPAYGMPYPEDGLAIQQMLGMAMSKVAMGLMSPEKARAFVILCAEMRKNLRQVQHELARQAIFVSGGERVI